MSSLPVRPSPAMAVAMLALMISLGGTAIGGKKAAAPKIPANSITSKHLKKGAVRASDIAANAVTAKAISALAVTTAALGDGVVTTAKLGDGAVTAPKLTEGIVTAGKLADGAVTAPKLANAAITAPKLGAGAVTSEAIATAAVTSNAIGEGAVTSNDLALASVDPATHFSSLIGTVSLATGAVQTTNIAADTPSILARSTVAQEMAGQNSVGTLGTPITFNSETWDTDGLHDNAVQNTRLVATDPGVYHVVAGVSWEADPDGLRQLTLFKNGQPFDSVNTRAVVDADGAALSTQQSIASSIKLATGDYVEVRGFQISAPCSPSFACLTSTLDVLANTATFSMTWQLPG